MNWHEVESRFKATVVAVKCVGVKESREAQWKVVRDRVIEHVRRLFLPL